MAKLTRRLVLAMPLVIGAACSSGGEGGGGSGSGEGGLGGEGGAVTTSAGTGGDYACGPDGLGSEASCACSACEADGGICETECSGAVGPLSTNCFRPHPPGPDEFSCLGLVTCPLSQVCVDLNQVLDGCNDTLCMEPPFACAEDLTCECLAQFFSDGACSAEGGGLLVTAAWSPDFAWECIEPPCA